MGLLFSRYTVIENKCERKVVELRECFRGDPEGRSTPPIVVEANTRELITARKFHRNSIDAGIPMVIKLYSDGVCFATLSPQDFIANIQLIIRNNSNGQMAVTRVRATPQQDLFYIRALACFLGDITGRPEEPL